MTDRANEIADALRGSCNSLQDHTTAAERDDLDLLEKLDALVLQCSQCGWWEDADACSTETGDVVCEDCEAD